MAKVFPWKQNFFKVPEEMSAKARGLGSNHVQVAAVKLIPSADIEAGQYLHVGLTSTGGEVRFQPVVAPPRASGRWSRTNIDGRVVRLKNLPKVPKTFEFETPNFGDWSKGSHTVSFERMVYQRRYIPPKHLAIQVEMLEPAQESHLFKFAVEEILDPNANDFDEALLYNLNLLQENVGVADVYSADASREEYLRTLSVTWELLPLGEAHGVLLRNRPDLTPAQHQIITDRFEFLTRLRPKSFILGTSGFQRYYGALLEDNLVVFENIRYGNAIYIMGENWRDNSHLSRTELLAKAQQDFARIPHVAGWKERTYAEVQVLRAKLAQQNAAPTQEEDQEPK